MNQPSELIQLNPLLQVTLNSSTCANNSKDNLFNFFIMHFVISHTFDMGVNLNQIQFVFRIRIIPEWSLKNKEVFRIGHMDCPRILFRIVPPQCLQNNKIFRIGRMNIPAFCSGSSPHGALKTWRCSSQDPWIVSAFCSRSSPYRALKTGRCSESNPNQFKYYFDTMILSAHVERISVSLMRNFFYIVFWPTFGGGRWSHVTWHLSHLCLSLANPGHLTSWSCDLGGAKGWRERDWSPKGDLWKKIVCNGTLNSQTS